MNCSSEIKLRCRGKSCWAVGSRRLLAVRRGVVSTLYAVLAFGLMAADPIPFLGAPHPVPGQIEAEHYDLGGEGVGHQGRGLLHTNEFGVQQLWEGRPGDSIAEMLSNTRSVIFRTGEWLLFTVECSSAGPYSLRLLTSGPPVWYKPDGCWPGETDCYFVGFASLELQVDDQVVTGPLEVSKRMLVPGIWMLPGIHRVRLRATAVTESAPRLYYLPSDGVTSRGFSIDVDWLRFSPAPSELFPQAISGSTKGYRDGLGSEARFGEAPILVGELAGGELVVQDTANAAIRVVSPDGHVRTWAGYPRSPVRDGVGTNAGFGKILHSALGPEGFLAVVEEAGPDGNRVRRVDSDGTVTTLFAGDVEVAFEEWGFGQTNHPVGFSRVFVSASGEVEAAGEFTRREIVDFSPVWFNPKYGDLTRSAYFRITNATATQIGEFRYGLPRPETLEFSDGLFGRADGRFWTLHVRDAEGFVEEAVPGVELSSVLQTRDGQLYCVQSPGSSEIMRLTPASELKVDWSGPGRVEGVPSGRVHPNQKIWLSAIPRTRFSRFLGWSDGSMQNPRMLMISRDTYLQAAFVQELPGRYGLVPGSVRRTPEGSVELSVVGDPSIYSYQVEVSDDLVQWRPVPAGSQVLPEVGSISQWMLEARAAETRVSIPSEGDRFFVRLELLDQ